MPKVYNKYHNDAPHAAVYIGRPSMWGNPFHMDGEHNRDFVCEKFEQYVRERPELINQIKFHLHGKDLVCFCSPKKCHGDTLLRIANEE